MEHNGVSTVFKIEEVTVYGLYEKPLKKSESPFYFQSIFLEGDVKGNLPFIKICPKSYSKGIIKKENKNFLSKILNLFSDLELPTYDKTNNWDNKEFKLHGVRAKVLSFCDEIVAISNLNETTWVKINISIPETGNFELWKKNLIKNKIEECKCELEKLKRTPECDYGEYVKLTKLLNELNKNSSK